MSQEPPLEHYDGQATPGAGKADLRKGRRKGPAARAALDIDRYPPHSIEAEQGVLGCCFLAPHETLAETLSVLKVTDTFYDLRHQEIMELLWEMYDAKEAIDVITVQQKLKDRSKLEAVGGIAYLATLPDLVPSAANLSFYLNIVKEKAILRKVVRGCTNIVAQVYEHQGEVDEMLDDVERQMLSISSDRIEENKVHLPKDLVHKAIGRIEMLHQNAGKLLGISTGFPDLDMMTQGMKGGEMIVVAARPSMGKTSLALNIAEAVAIDQKLPVGVFSLEMSAESLMVRMLCSRARINLNNVAQGFLSERDFPKITSAAGKVANAPLYIDDSSGLSIMELRAKARRMFVQYGIKLFVIDYLQLLHSTSNKCQNRQQEIADISSGIKSIAKELDVPVLVAAQLNRDIEKEKGRKPRMSDLRESGAIEQDADLIGLLYKPKGGDEDDEGAAANEEAIAVNLLIAKQRNGPTGDVNLTFLKTYTRFESAAKITPDTQTNLPGTE